VKRSKQNRWTAYLKNREKNFFYFTIFAIMMNSKIHFTVSSDGKKMFFVVRQENMSVAGKKQLASWCSYIRNAWRI